MILFRRVLMLAALVILGFNMVSLNFNELMASSNKRPFLMALAMILSIVSLFISNRAALKNKR